ncbi:helix-turn-helix domain-containing protein [Streptomyces sp. NBC_01259]|uniref:helix-turn-helix domain-containing protein n=1 Tax=Streptomyces sp. NBC_01259 TaxID=2903800 RepID=UPI003250DA0D
MAGLFKRIASKMFTSKSAPVRPTTQAAHVRERKYNGSTKDMAAAFGVKERTVQRWLKGDRTPKGKDASRLETEAAAVQVTDKGRERKAKAYAKEGSAPTDLRVRVDRAGSFDIKGSNAVRPRTIEVDLNGDQAARLARATDEDGVKAVVGDALAGYFNSGPYGGFQGGDFDFDVSGVDLT